MPTFVPGLTRATRFATEEWRFRRIYQKYRTFTMTEQMTYIGNLRVAAKAMQVPGSDTWLLQGASVAQNP